MAAGDASPKPGNNEEPRSQASAATKPPSSVDESEEDDEGDEDEEEPRLKYATLTRNVSSIYRNGDATSTFLVAGDKMVSYRLRNIS
jgi:hypothetical protein